MNQKQKPRLYFTNDFSPENVKKLQGQGWTLRRASAYRPGDSLEECSEVSGDVPQAYLDAEKKANGKLAVGNSKADYEKVIAKNAELTEQLKKEREAVKKLTDEVSDTKAILQAIEAERDALAAKLTALEAKETVIVVNETAAIDSEKNAVNAAKAAKAKT